MAAFAATLDDDRRRPAASAADADAALVVPGHLDTGHPFTDPADREHIARTLAQAYVAARQADLPVALARESDGLGPDARLYLVPVDQAAARAGLAPRWSGSRPAAPVYLSYFAGRHRISAGRGTGG